MKLAICLYQAICKALKHYETFVHNACKNKKFCFSSHNWGDKMIVFIINDSFVWLIVKYCRLTSSNLCCLDNYNLIFISVIIMHQVGGRKCCQSDFIKIINTLPATVAPGLSIEPASRRSQVQFPVWTHILRRRAGGSRQISLSLFHSPPLSLK